MHNECSVQKYKETKAETRVQYGRSSSILSFDEAQREREREGCAYVAMTEDVLCCDSG